MDLDPGVWDAERARDWVLSVLHEFGGVVSGRPGVCTEAQAGV